MADVVLEVLDARDPLGCRSYTTEQQILALDPNKKIILVLNKIGAQNSVSILLFFYFLFLSFAFSCPRSHPLLIC
jgi:hypothetical protein